jgi:hypothetical protein
VIRLKVGCEMSSDRVRCGTALIAALVFLAAAGCGSNSPNAVDPPLREAADHFAGLLSAGNGEALSQSNGGKDDGRLAGLLASYGGVETHPLAYNSEGAGTAYVLFTAQCSSGSQILHQSFIYVSGKWKPNLANTEPAVEGPIPPTNWPTSLVPTEAALPACH